MGSKSKFTRSFPQQLDMGKVLLGGCMFACGSNLGMKAKTHNVFAVSCPNMAETPTCGCIPYAQRCVSAVWNFGSTSELTFIATDQSVGLVK